MTQRKTATKAKATSLFARITATLFDPTHIDQCRQKFHDLSEEAFVTLMRKAHEIGADPLRGDIYVKMRDGGFNVIATVAAMRAYAEAQGDYAGDDQTLHVLQAGTYKPEVGATASVLVVDTTKIDLHTNPDGIDYCAMGVYRRIHGEWRRFAHTVTWKDYVPLFNGEIAGEAWRNLPVVMIQKVAEVGALRKAYPALGIIYIEEEMAQADVDRRAEGRFIDVHKEPVRQIARATGPAATARGRRAPVLTYGAAASPFRGITIDVNFLNGSMTPVAVADYPNRVGEFLQNLLVKGHPQKVIEWFEKNARARQEFYVADERNGHRDAMRLKTFFETANQRMQQRPKADRGGRTRQRMSPRSVQEARA